MASNEVTSQTINRARLRNIFLMYQGDVETRVPDFAKELKQLLNIKTTKANHSVKVEGVDKKFAQDLSKKFFNNFHKEQFTKNEDDIEQRYEDIDKEQLQCMKIPEKKKHNTTTQVRMKGQDLKKKKHKTAMWEDPLSSHMEIQVPNKYLCYDCGVSHYSEARECEHCGVVHAHCCEVY